MIRIVSLFWFPWIFFSIQTPDVHQVVVVYKKLCSSFVYSSIYWFDCRNHYSIDLSSNSDPVAAFRCQGQSLRNNVDAEVTNYSTKYPVLTSESVTSSCVDPGRTGREGEKTRLSIWGKLKPNVWEVFLSQVEWHPPFLQCPSVPLTQTGFQENFAHPSPIRTPVVICCTHTTAG